MPPRRMLVPSRRLCWRRFTLIAGCATFTNEAQPDSDVGGFELMVRNLFLRHAVRLQTPAAFTNVGAVAGLPARVAKLADARDLKSRVPRGTYRFDSGPGHQLTHAGTIGF